MSSKDCCRTTIKNSNNGHDSDCDSEIGNNKVERRLSQMKTGIWIFVYFTVRRMHHFKPDIDFNFCFQTAYNNGLMTIQILGSHMHLTHNIQHIVNSIAQHTCILYFVYDRNRFSSSPSFSLFSSFS